MNRIRLKEIIFTKHLSLSVTFNQDRQKEILNLI